MRQSRPRIALAAWLTLGLTACQTTQTTQPAASITNEQVKGFQPSSVLPNIVQPQQLAKIDNPLLSEISGMAFSKRTPGTLWMVNDSGNAAALFAVDLTGRTIAQWQLSVPNRDWEDLASIKHNGDAYLLLAEIGDNLRVKTQHSIYVFREPETGDLRSEPLTPIHTLRFRYRDGKHNAESIASDGKTVYIATKLPVGKDGPTPSKIYTIPFANSGTTNITLVAEPIAQLVEAERNLEAILAATLAGVDLNQATAMDIDAQNNTAYILTYRSVLHFERKANETWAKTFSRAGQTIHKHQLAQAEALAIAANGNIWFSSEKLPAPLWALPTP